MKCKLCQEQGKPEDFDSDPRCAFEGEFADNWQCATVAEIRDVCDADIRGVDYQYCDDMKYSTLKVDELEFDDGNLWLALWVSWYKSRGTTDALWLLSDEYPPRRPSERECLMIASHYKAKMASVRNHG